jgi:transcriptional regulator with XRE-family HTH domain
MEGPAQLRYRRTMGNSSKTARPVGDLLRQWRQHRRKSQLQFACDAEISTKHLSFLETGRSQPSRDMVLRLAELLEVPLRERNALLAAAGFAPVFPERKLNDPALALARQAIDTVLQGHEPYPALAVDRHWNLVASNRMAQAFLRDIDESLLTNPPNVLRVSLHPKGMAPRIANLIEWRTHLLERLRHQVDVSADEQLAALYRELSSYPLPDRDATGMTPAAMIVPKHEYASMVVPFKLITPHGVMSFFSTTTVFGTAVDITLSELAIEAFFPADAATAEALRAIAAGQA